MIIKAFKKLLQIIKFESFGYTCFNHSVFLKIKNNPQNGTNEPFFLLAVLRLNIE